MAQQKVRIRIGVALTSLAVAALLAGPALTYGLDVPLSGGSTTVQAVVNTTQQTVDSTVSNVQSTVETTVQQAPAAVQQTVSAPAAAARAAAPTAAPQQVV